MAHHADYKEVECVCGHIFLTRNDDKLCIDCEKKLQKFLDAKNHIATTYIQKAAIVLIPKRYYNKRDSKGRFIKR